MAPSHSEIYGTLRAAILARHFALRKFSRADYFTNQTVLGEIPDWDVPPGGSANSPRIRPCGRPPRVPRRNGRNLYGWPGASANAPPQGISGHERWRIWNHDHTNALSMTGMRLIHLCVDFRLGDPFARKVIRSTLLTIDALFKYPESSPYGGYILRWDPAADDDWTPSIDGQGGVTPTIAGRFLLNPFWKKDNPEAGKYLYCTPLTDPRYLQSKDPSAEVWGGHDRYRRWEPSKDEYIALLAGLCTVYDTFHGGTSGEDPEIVPQVRAQMGRMARYLQRFGYLLVRPCGGVTMRGPGEILPLVEFAWNRLFQRVLGDSHPSADGSYEQALWAAGFSRPPEPAGPAADLRNLAQGLLSGGAFEAALQAAGLSTAGSLLDQLTGRNLAILVHLLKHQDEVDVDSDGTRQEVWQGYFYSCLPRGVREKVFLGWLAGPGSAAYDVFKPHIALLFLHDEGLTGVDLDFAASVRKNYLDWFTVGYRAACENPLDPSALPKQSLRDGGHDWGYRTAVAMLVAYKEQDSRYAAFAASVAGQLQQMRDQLLEEKSRHPGTDAAVPITVFGAGCAPLEDAELPAPVESTQPGVPGMLCVAHVGPRPETSPQSRDHAQHVEPRLPLVSEFHDKNGDWFGYLSTLALAWRHLMELPGGQPSPFPSGTDIGLPDIAPWPREKEIVVPQDVVLEAHDQPYRMTIRLDAISAREPAPLGNHEVPIFLYLPPRTRDDDIGEEEDPVEDARGEYTYNGDCKPADVPMEWDCPVPAQISGRQPPWTPVPMLEVLESYLVETPPGQPALKDGNSKCATSVKFKAAELRFGWPPWRYGYIKVRLRLKWMPPQ
jgi:hypothetical protein